MKKILTLLAVLIIALFSAVPAYAADGKVTYNKNAGDFVFEPGSEYSLTDLFPNFKGVMPGDDLTQKILVKNNADNKVKVKIYMRSLGASNDPDNLLSHLTLKVKKSSDNEMAYMFDAYANETDGLTDWVCLGTLYSGGEVNLDVILNVPIELDNDFQNKIGSLDWEFKIEEFPVEPDDPKAPQMSDNSYFGLLLGIMIFSLAMIIILLVWRKKNKEKENNDKQI